MPRTARLHTPAVVHHVISRFVNGEFLVANDSMRHEYLRRIGHALGRSSWQLLAYAVMSSHTHLALWAGEEPLAAWIQGAHSGFAGWLQRSGRGAGARARGPVFADRPTTVLLEPERTAYLIAYLHNNPVRAGVAPTAEESMWTSHQAYLGVAAPPPFVHVDRGLELCGFCADPQGRKAFGALVRAHAGITRDPDLTGSGVGTLSTAVRARTNCSAQLASPMLGAAELRFPLVQTPAILPLPAFLGTAIEVAMAVALKTRISIARLTGRGRASDAVEARRLAILAWARLGRRPSEIASALGLSRSAVSKVMSRSNQDEAPSPLLGAILRELAV